MEVESYNICLFVSGLFDLALCCSMCQSFFLFCDRVILHCMRALCLSLHGLNMGCFHLLTIVNNASLNLGVQVSVLSFFFPILSSIYLGAIAGLNSNSMFSFLKNC
jgi:hypothetical protein